MGKKSSAPVHFSFFTRKEQEILASIALDFFSAPSLNLEEMKWRAPQPEILETLAFCRHLPFLRKIFLVNSYSFGAPNPGDYDLFIVLKKDFLYLGRAFITLVFHFKALRRHGRHIHQRFCLSFWAVEAVNLQNYYHKNHVDWYFMLWEELKIEIPFSSSFFARFLEKILGFTCFEKMAKKIQQRRFQKNSLRLTDSTGLVMNEEVLKFHNEDRRYFYYELWMKELEKKSPTLYKKLKLFET